MFDLSPEKILVFGIIALVVLGPERLPLFARRAGQLLAHLKHASGGFQEELRNAMAEPRKVLDEAVSELGLPSVPAIPSVPSVRSIVAGQLSGAFDTTSRPAAAPLAEKPLAAPFGGQQPAPGQRLAPEQGFRPTLDQPLPPAPDDPTLN